jgi:hypothetical protein
MIRNHFCQKTDVYWEFSLVLYKIHQTEKTCNIVVMQKISFTEIALISLILAFKSTNILQSVYIIFVFEKTAIYFEFITLTKDRFLSVFFLAHIMLYFVKTNFYDAFHNKMNCFGSRSSLKRD